MGGLTRALAIVLLAAAGAVQGASSGVEFSARVEQRGPQGVIESGRLFVGGDRSRNEMSQGGRNLVQIVHGAERVAYTLDPERKVYVALRGPAAAGGAAPDSSGDPCAGMPGAGCTRIGEDEIDGRRAVKWEIRVPDPQGGELSMTQWIDSERGVPLRSESPDGSRMSLVMVGRETLEGRSVEKWESRMERPGGEVRRSHQWYDPELELVIREEFPGGYLRALTDIRIAPQPDSLFEIPEGYREMSAADAGRR